MRSSQQRLTAFLLLASSSAELGLCEGAGLRYRATDSASPVDQRHRALSGGYREVYSFMVDAYGGEDQCTTTRKSGKVITECTNMGSEATFTSIGTTQDPAPTTLERCEIQSEADKDCQSWQFDGSKKTAHDIIKEAFEKEPAGYYAVLATMVPYFSGECTIRRSANTATQQLTTVSCSKPGMTADLIAQGRIYQEPTKITVCSFSEGASERCNT